MDDCNGGLSGIMAIVNKQAEDEGLWFAATSISEAYLQQELRKLHYIIETEYNRYED